MIEKLETFPFFIDVFLYIYNFPFLFMGILKILPFLDLEEVRFFYSVIFICSFFFVWMQLMPGIVNWYLLAANLFAYASVLLIVHWIY